MAFGPGWTEKPGYYFIALIVLSISMVVWHCKRITRWVEVKHIVFPQTK
jgi:hypothetical protein